MITGYTLVEACAGLGALSVYVHTLQAPPLGRPGSKAGYAEAIARVVGLRCAERYVLAEPNAGVRALLAAYGDHALAEAAADVLEGWGATRTDPDLDRWELKLWESLRDAGPYSETPTAEDLARWVWVQGRAINEESGFKRRKAATHKRRKNRTEIKALRQELGAHIAERRTAKGLARADVAEAVVGTRSGACWNWEHGQPVSVKHWAALRDLLGLDPAWDAVVHQAEDVTEVVDCKGWVMSMPSVQDFAARLRGLPCLPVEVHGDARTLPWPGGRVVVYIDPPYRGTTGYLHDLDRQAVVALAKHWRALGALVVISEAEPIRELEGWHTVEITELREGAGRSISKQQREWLTLSEPPAWRPPPKAEQLGLFVAA